MPGAASDMAGRYLPLPPCQDSSGLSPLVGGDISHPAQHHRAFPEQALNWKCNKTVPVDDGQGTGKVQGGGPAL